MATVNQKDVTWVKKGDMVNGKKTTKGYLALRSDKSKAFSGTVTGVKTGSTSTSKAGTATYAGGRNVVATAARNQAKSGSSAAAGISPRSASGSTGSRAPLGAMTRREMDARSATKSKLQKAREANPFFGGRASGIGKKKDGSYTTAGGTTGGTARETLAKERARIKKNEARDNAALVTMALAPAALIGGGAAAAGGAAARLAIGAGSRAAVTGGRAALPSAARAALQSGGRTTVTAGRAVRNPGPSGARAAGKGTPKAIQGRPAPKAIEGPKAANKPTPKNPSPVRPAGKGPMKDSGVRSPAREAAAARRSAAAKKAAATRAANKAAGKKK